MSQFQILLLLFAVSSAYGLFESVTLVDNRYEGIVVAINPSVPENPFIINEIRDVFTDASSVLWESTEHRAYFGTVTILVPLTWKGNYNLATNGEVYAKADFVVADPNPMFESVPYTEQYTECGQPGEFIHLTPDFLLKDDYVQNYGPKGKTVIHEWAHLRWGVYDEYATEGYEPFYYSTQIYDQGYVEATRCPLSLTGHTVYPNPQNGNKLEACHANSSNNYMPNEGCVFIPNGPYGQPDDLDASLMSHQFMDQVIHFCHDDPTDPTNMHNKEAPNEHNRLCGQKSVWEIIMSSPDFRYANPPNPSISDVTPSFSIIRQPTNRFVLVLDGSGSMGGDRYENMMQAATDFIMNFVT
uniref:Calcium-activated chloride channel N-terminal domain-containing protein n=1 Tax=Ciona savignyi TaxID=51511 RepID=H2ZFE2_CIOSA